VNGPRFAGMSARQGWVWAYPTGLRQ